MRPLRAAVLSLIALYAAGSLGGCGGPRYSGYGYRPAYVHYARPAWPVYGGGWGHHGWHHHW